MFLSTVISACHQPYLPDFGGGFSRKGDNKKAKKWFSCKFTCFWHQIYGLVTNYMGCWSEGREKCYLQVYTLSITGYKGQAHEIDDRSVKMVTGPWNWLWNRITNDGPMKKETGLLKWCWKNVLKKAIFGLDLEKVITSCCFYIYQRPIFFRRLELFTELKNNYWGKILVAKLCKCLSSFKARY